MVAFRTLIAPCLAIAALFVGLCDTARARDASAGVVRQRFHDPGSAAVEDSLDVETDDADAEDPDDDVLAGGAPHDADARAGRGRWLAVRRPTFAPRRSPATAFIRGPPARG